jgi:hypothetical protein
MNRFDQTPIYGIDGKIKDWVVAHPDELNGPQPLIIPDDWWD